MDAVLKAAAPRVRLSRAVGGSVTPVGRRPFLLTFERASDVEATIRSAALGVRRAGVKQRVARSGVASGITARPSRATDSRTPTAGGGSTASSARAYGGAAATSERNEPEPRDDGYEQAIGEALHEPILQQLASQLQSERSTAFSRRHVRNLRGESAGCPSVAPGYPGQTPSTGPSSLH